MSPLAFDVALIAVLWLVATACLASANLFRAVVMFIAFGLLLALAWVRLRAPDIALAEAAIGAGLSGVLLLDAVGYLQRRGGDGDGGDGGDGEGSER